MNDTIALCTLAMEAGIALAWLVEAVQRYIHDGRVMVLSFIDAYLPPPETEQ